VQRLYLCMSLVNSVCVCLCLWHQSASVFVFDKRFSGKMLRPKKKDAVMEMLRADVSGLMRFRSPRMLRVLHPVEECRYGDDDDNNNNNNNNNNANVYGAIIMAKPLQEFTRFI